MKRRWPVLYRGWPVLSKIFKKSECFGEIRQKFFEKFAKNSSNFDELIPLIDTGLFTIVQRRDEELKFYNKIYREYQLKDTTYIDTLGFASIKDSIFGENYIIQNLRLIPHAQGTELELRAGKIKSGSLTVQVFEAKAPKEEYLKGLDEDLVKNASKDLTVGSMTSAKINGNWE